MPIKPFSLLRFFVSSKVFLTDDSSDVAATSTPGGPRYNIVSGALGTVNKAATQRRYGYFYPNLGLLIFDKNALTQSTGFADGVAETTGVGIIIVSITAHVIKIFP